MSRTRAKPPRPRPRPKPGQRPNCAPNYAAHKPPKRIRQNLTEGQNTTRRCVAHTTQTTRPRPRPQRGRRPKQCPSNNPKTTEANLTKPHIKIENNKKVRRAQEPAPPPPPPPKQRSDTSQSKPRIFAQGQGHTEK